MKNLSAELKVGIFAILVLIVLAFITVKISGVMSVWHRGYRVYVVFDNISGLDEKSRVKVAGVDAGIVEKIRLKDGKAELTLLMDPDVKIYKDSMAALRVAGFLGDKYLSVATGSPTEPRLGDGGRITRVDPPIDIDALANELTSAAARINELAEGFVEIFGDSEKQDIKDIFRNVRSISANLDEILRDGKEPFMTTLRRMESFSSILDEKGPILMEDLSMAARELREVIEENRGTFKESVEHIKTFSESADRIVGRLDRGEGTLGKLLTDEELYHSLNDVAQGVSKSIKTVDRLRTFMEFRSEYLTKEGNWKGYFDLTLQPREDKYYIFGVVSDPIGSGETTNKVIEGVRTMEEEVTRKVEFTAQFAKRFEDFAVRIGMIENTFGVGADYFFIDDSAKVTFNTWDFGGDEADADSAHMKIGLDYTFFKNVFIGGGIDNLLNENRMGIYVGGGLKFEDEDFKYIFGSSPGLPGQ